MPPISMPIAILPLDFPCSGPVTRSGEILTTGTSHGKTFEETSGYVSPERVNKWPNSIKIYDDDDDAKPTFIYGCDSHHSIRMY